MMWLEMMWLEMTGMAWVNNGEPLPSLLPFIP